MTDADKPETAVASDALAPVVDFGRAARRLRASALTLGSLAVLAWLVSGLVTGGLRGSGLTGWLGLAIGGMFIVEVVVVGGSALRGMARAGDRGHRLAQSDVSLLPPQLTQRLTRAGGELRQPTQDRPSMTSDGSS